MLDKDRGSGTLRAQIYELVDNKNWAVWKRYTIINALKNEQTQTNNNFDFFHSENFRCFCFLRSR